MPHVASWIRECDEALFSRFAARHPQIRVRNARVDPIDLDAIDGLLITGGPDISGQFLHQPIPDPDLIEDEEPTRDRWEFAALASAYQRGLPLLCICKGVQILNVGLGGTLHLHIEGHNLRSQKSHNVQPLRYDPSATHRFDLVNSSHHQALDRLADPLIVEAWHAGDDIIEQVRIKDYPWGVGVQYHPERDFLYAPLFDDFFSRIRL
jgi:putative glutamine amidotransferase